jgi:hypothetical protein
MKKLIFIFTVFLFISCESDDLTDDSNNGSNSNTGVSDSGDDTNNGSDSGDDTNNGSDLDNSVLVKTITTTTDDGDYSSVITEEYFYEDNKIERKLQYSSEYNNSDDVYYTTYYTYANNKISNVKIYDFDNDLVEEFVFDYDSNGNLSSYTEEYFEYSEISSYSFTYDGNYILSCETESYYGNDYNDYNKYTTNSNGDITFAENIQLCNFSAQRSTGEDASTANVEYDSNPSPFKNIEGNNFLITTDASIFTYADLYGYYNNVTKIERSYFDESYSTELKFDYNSDNYPRNVQIFEDGELYESVNIEYY